MKTLNKAVARYNGISLIVRILIGLFIGDVYKRQPWGLAVGFIAPLVRSVLFGMPPMFPIAISMAFELAAYGLVSGVLWHKVKHTVPMMYASLVTAMVAGRLVWGAVRFVPVSYTHLDVYKRQPQSGPCGTCGSPPLRTRRAAQRRRAPWAAGLQC